MANLCFFLLLLLSAVSRTTSTTCDISIPINYNGTIESPGFPDEYYGNQSCLYSLQSSFLGIWQINFTFFNLPNKSCETDYLEVDYNLYQQRYCLNSTPPDLTNIYQLRFVSSLNRSAGYGFQARVSMVLECGMTDIHLEENTPHALYYAYFEPVQGRCEWTVTADQGLSIMMIGNTNSINYEYIKSQFKMYKGRTKDQSSLINFKTRNNKFALDEASNTILIEYIANGTFSFVVSVVFKAYNATQSSTCGSTMYAGNGEGDIGLTTNELPYIEGFYRNGICAWTIEAEENEVLQLVVRYFSIQTEAPGCNDSARSYLEIYDGSQAASSLLVRACIYDPLVPVTSTTRRLVVVLTLDDDIGFTAASFQARYKSFNKTAILRDCGGDISGNEGVVSSPNYPANYDNLRVCEWRITVENLFNIRVDIHDLDISPSTTGYYCAEDSLLFTGAYPLGDTGPYYRLCGMYGFGFPLYSANNSLTMKFVSDWQNNGRGFNASWRKACDWVQQTSSGWVQSPKFPAGYPNNVDCSYIIETPNNEAGYFITFIFNSFDLQEPDAKGSCIYDYLEILQVPFNSNSYPVIPPDAKKFCGKGPTQSLTTYFPTTIKFVTDNSITKGGFNISFVQTMAGCSKSLFVGEEGFISSPNHPGTFPPNLNCTTTIRVRPGHNITLTFQSFFLGDFLPMDNGSDCWRQSQSVLEIYDNILSGSDLIGIYCGYKLPRTITSTGNELTLIFRSNSNGYATGYNATYTSTSTLAGKY